MPYDIIDHLWLEELTLGLAIGFIRLAEHSGGYYTVRHEVDQGFYGTSTVGCEMFAWGHSNEETE